jgi:hypothetical protein
MYRKHVFNFLWKPPNKYDYTTPSKNIFVSFFKAKVIFPSSNIQKTKVSGRIGVGVWGWMSSHGVGEVCEVCEVRERMNSEDYTDIMEDIMIPSVNIMFENPERFVFMQVNRCLKINRCNYLENNVHRLKKCIEAREIWY